MLSLYRALAHLRQQEPALAVGDYATVDTAVPDIFAYQRTYPGAASFLVVLNFGGEARTVDMREAGETAVIALSTTLTRTGPVTLHSLGLQANEGLLLRLSN